MTPSARQPINYYGELLLTALQSLSDVSTYATDMKGIQRAIRSFNQLREMCEPAILKTVYEQHIKTLVQAKKDKTLSYIDAPHVSEIFSYFENDNTFLPGLFFGNVANVEHWTSVKNYLTQKARLGADKYDKDLENAKNRATLRAQRKIEDMKKENPNSVVKTVEQYIEVDATYNRVKNDWVNYYEPSPIVERLTNTLTQSFNLLQTKFICALTIALAIDSSRYSTRGGVLSTEQASKNSLISDAYQNTAIIEDVLSLTFHSNVMASAPIYSADPLDAKIIHLVGMVYSLCGQQEVLVDSFCTHYRLSVQAKKHITTATLVNCVVSTLLVMGDYERADNMISLSQFVETSVPAGIYARCLFNVGRLLAIKGDYSGSIQKLSAAVRKVAVLSKRPIDVDEDVSTKKSEESDVAIDFEVRDHNPRSFVITILKHHAVVQLLTGEIPNSDIFRKYPELEIFEAISVAVSNGDTIEFNRIRNDFSQSIQTRGGASDHFILSLLIERLYSSVIRAGIKRISHCYQRITIADVAKMLNIESLEECEMMIGKAISDRVFDGFIEGDVVTSSHVERQSLSTKLVEFTNQTTEFIANCSTGMQWATTTRVEEARTEMDLFAEVEAMLEDEDDDLF